MQLRLFFSIFFLIFIAELGDKTQLAAMARAADSGGAKWTVFFAASAALVASTFIAIVLGDALTRIIPLKYIRLAAALAFVIIGLFMLRSILWPAKEQVRTKPLAAARAPGFVSRFVMSEAAAFEKAAFTDYRALAAQTEKAAMRELLKRLADEEEQHLHILKGSGVDEHEFQIKQDEAEALPCASSLIHNVAASPDDNILEHAIRHEQATADFYRELARLTPLPTLSKTFSMLARAEEEHIRQLQDALSAPSSRA